MSKQVQYWCVWTIPVFIGIYVAAFISLSGFVPPPSPTLSGEALAVLFEENQFGIRAGQLICLVGSCAVIQMLTIGLSVLNDRNPEPILPSRVGYFNIWLAVLQMPRVMSPYPSTAPLSGRSGYF